jgi:hypothetical protein
LVLVAGGWFAVQKATTTTRANTSKKNEHMPFIAARYRYTPNVITLFGVPVSVVAGADDYLVETYHTLCVKSPKLINLWILRTGLLP